jgi:hypothetical protein
VAMVVDRVFSFAKYLGGLPDIVSLLCPENLEADLMQFIWENPLTDKSDRVDRTWIFPLSVITFVVPYMWELHAGIRLWLIFSAAVFILRNQLAEAIK